MAANLSRKKAVPPQPPKKLLIKLHKVCLDGTLPGYHLDTGFGSGENSWFIHLEGGGWCDSVRTCVYRKRTRRGSSKYMKNQIQFTGTLSNKAEENPDFYNWNRVKLRYCDGASFSGDSENESAQLQFRGQKIWLAAIEELMSKGMQEANQSLFPNSSEVKCLSDAGFFTDAIDVSGGRTLRILFEGVVQLQVAFNVVTW